MKEKLRGMPEGTFLVCDSQNEGEYVLVVTQGGNTELADISYLNNAYGICNYSLVPVRPVFTFPTIPALIEHFRRFPVKAVTKRNVYLNVTLAHPTPRSNAYLNVTLPTPTVVSWYI